MYIVSKDIRRTYREYGSRTVLNDTIDDLFNAENLETIDIPDYSYVHYDLLRTKTTLVPDNTHFLGEISDTNLSIICRRIIDICNKHPNPQDEYYHFRLPKKTGGFRPIDAPEKDLKKDMKEIVSILLRDLKLLTHDSAWAYVNGRDVVHAMQEHTNNKSRWYLKIDLKNFFGSCSPDFIYKQLQTIYPFANNLGVQNVLTMLDKLTDLACLNNGLPQGTPLSPLLTNLIMIEFDYKINKLLNTLVKDNKLYKQRYVYTRYADDIIISAKCKFNYELVLKELKKLFKDTPLKINNDKTRFGTSAGRNWNLGIMCNKDNKTTIGYKRKQKLKAAIHNYILTRTDWTLEDLQYLLGQLSWLHNVEPTYFEQFIQYCLRKYNLNIWNELIDDIKRNS